MSEGNGMGVGMGEMTGMMLRFHGQLADLAGRNQALEQELGQLKITETVTQDWLQVPFRFVGLLPTATSILTRTVAGDGPFDLIEVTYTARDIVTLAATNALRIRIREGEAVGRSLTQDNEFVDIDNSAGTAQRPYIIKGRRRFRANIAIVLEVTSTDPVNTITVECVLHGIKCFTR